MTAEDDNPEQRDTLELVHDLIEALSRVTNDRDFIVDQVVELITERHQQQEES